MTEEKIIPFIRPEVFRCRICGNILNGDVLKLDNVPEYTFEISDKTITLNITECHFCGAVQLVDVPVGETWMENNRSIGSTGEYREKKKRELQWLLDNYLQEKTEMLEIGCGDGQYLEIFKELGVSVDGAEGGQKNVSAAKKKGFNVFPFTENITKKYDAVFMFYFLEHVPNPAQLVGNIFHTLKPGGLFYAEVPDYEEIKKRNLWLEFTRDHRFYYTEKSIRALLLNFDIEFIKQGDLCLRVAARKPEILSFDAMRKAFEDDVQRFKDIIKDFDEYVVVGAGHYTQLILNQIHKMPVRIFDSVPAKQDYKLRGIDIEPQNAIADCDVGNIIISCGIYNKEAKRNIEPLVGKRNIILWG